VTVACAACVASAVIRWMEIVGWSAVPLDGSRASVSALHVAALWAVVAMLILVNGVFVAAEISIVGSNATRLQRLAEDGNPRAGSLARVRAEPHRLGQYFAVTQVGITLASIGLGMYGERQLAAILAPSLAGFPLLGSAAAHALAAPIAIVLLSYLHITIGEMVPKALALRDPERAALTLLPLMTFSRILLLPVASGINALGRTVAGALPLGAPTEGDEAFSSSELGRVIVESADEGLIARRDEQIMLEVIGFAERTVRQVMTPRTRVEAVPMDVPEAELDRILAESHHSRFPVFRDDIDHIVGVLHLKDYLRDRLQAGGQPLALETITRKVRFLPEHTPLTQAMEIFRRSREHLAVVMDEYGGTAGIATLEDVVEELVGEVRDEFDTEIPPIRRVRAGVWAIRGDVQLDDLAERLPIPDSRPDADTVGGLLVHLLGRPARQDDVAEIGDLRLVAQSVTGYSVDLVRVEHVGRQVS